jgi:pimeloyl-ACP methyl ester carboxylesterase
LDFFFFNGFLYVKFLLGHDIVLRLTPTQEFFELERNDVADVEFEMSITTNPFCMAKCSYRFKDISFNNVIEVKESSLRTLIPSKLSFPINASWLGKGQRLYRFRAECHNEKSFLCHTDEIPTSKTTLITLNHDINKEDKEIKKDIKPKLNSMVESIEEYQGKILWMRYLVKKLQEISNVNDLNQSVLQLNESTSNMISQIKELQTLWYQENYVSLKNDYDLFVSENLNNYFDDVEATEAFLIKNIDDYNLAIKRLDTIYDELLLIRNLSLDNLSIVSEINKLISAYKEVTEIFSQKTLSIEIKVSSVEKLNSDMNNVRSYKDELISKISNLKLKIYLGYNDLCNLTNNTACFDYNSTSNNILEICQDLKSLHDYYNKSINDSYNKTLLLPEKCLISNITSNFTLEKKEFVPFSGDVNVLLFNLNVSFDEQDSKCCIFNKCETCCDSDSCNKDEYYPIIFLHGHAFNKDVEADYSLEGFNELQSKLESSGYLDGGSVSLYTDQKFIKGNWGRVPMPISLKATYYLDIFFDTGNYVLVETKSENVDTYAIRLKELIDTIKYRTAKDKVKIIAHSMGGLVSRRYLQVFGSDSVHSLLMIGTPNKGIEGNVADICSLVGEDLECRDMSKNSLFLNKLNRDPLPDIPIWIIVGSGCDMSGKDGDGIVLKESAYIESATNKFIEGTCKGITHLHTEMLDPMKYPDVLEIITEFLEE